MKKLKLAKEILGRSAFTEKGHLEWEISWKEDELKELRKKRKRFTDELKKAGISEKMKKEWKKRKDRYPLRQCKKCGKILGSWNSKEYCEEHGGDSKDRARLNELEDLEISSITWPEGGTKRFDKEYGEEMKALRKKLGVEEPSEEELKRRRSEHLVEFMKKCREANIPRSALS